MTTFTLHHHHLHHVLPPHQVIIHHLSSMHGHLPPKLTRQLTHTHTYIYTHTSLHKILDFCMCHDRKSWALLAKTTCQYATFPRSPPFMIKTRPHIAIAHVSQSEHYTPSHPTIICLVKNHLPHSLSSSTTLDTCLARKIPPTIDGTFHSTPTAEKISPLSLSYTPPSSHFSCNFTSPSKANT